MMSTPPGLLPASRIALFLFLLRKHPEYPLRQFKHKHDPQYDGHRHLKSHITGLGRLVQFICHDIIGGPVHPRAGYQRKEAGNQKYGDRTPFPDRKKPRQQNHHDRGKERSTRRGTALNQNGVNGPAGSADQSAVWIILCGNPEQEGK